MALVDFVPLVPEPITRNAGGRPKHEFTEEQLQAAHAHFIEHGRRQQGKLAESIGVTARQAARLLAAEADIVIKAREAQPNQVSALNHFVSGIPIPTADGVQLTQGDIAAIIGDQRLASVQISEPGGSPETNQ
jgi:hypothetical protein